MNQERVRRALVTGASRGIGRAISLSLAKESKAVVLADIRVEGLKAVAEEVEQQGAQALTVEMDVTRPESVHGALEEIQEKLGGLDHLVNNAGITRDALLARMKNEHWEQVLATNLTGTYLVCREVVRAMMKQRYGRIVNIASVVGLMGNAGQTNYCASKAGVIGFTKALARETGPRGVTVNAVAPGFIDTEMTAGLSEEVRAGFQERIPLKRAGSPVDVARAVRFLVSDDASYISGQVLSVCGGMYM